MLSRRLEAARHAKDTWDPVAGGKRAWVCFDDSLLVDLGEDPSGEGLRAIAANILSGDYYPASVVEFLGEFRIEGRQLRAGDAILQRARLAGFIRLWSVARVWVAESGSDRCTLGYVTTDQHLGRGIWQVEVTRCQGRLSLRVQSTASPGSWAFWVGLPVARWVQLRARRQGIANCRRILAKTNCAS